MNWPLVKFSDVATVITGTTPKKVDGNYGGNIPFVTPGDLGKVSEVIAAKINVSEAGAKSARLLPAGSVLVCCIGATIGKVGIAKVPVVTNQQINSLAFDEERVYPKYGYYYCCTITPLLRHRSSSTTMPIVNKTEFSTFEIPLPPLKEQKRIAAILDKADAIRRKRQAAIELADQFLRSVFLDLFGDPVTNPKGLKVESMDSICKKVTDGTHHSPKAVEIGVPYITAKHIRANRVDFYRLPTYVSEVAHKEIYSRCAPVRGDVLYIKDGATTGAAAINEYDFEFSMLSSLALIKPDYSKVRSEYLCDWLNAKSNKQRILRNVSGAAITRLTIRKIKDLSVELPSMELQDEYSVVRNNVLASINKHKDGLVKAEVLFDSLTQKAFKGELGSNLVL